VDPVEVRRKNLIASDAFPYTTSSGTTYDTGEYALALDTAMDLAGYSDLRREQAERRTRGDHVVLGIGCA
jgi:CO/xanthine dehydrogenase Mo-binding subunit